MNEVVFTKTFDLKFEKASTSPWLIAGIVVLILVLAAVLYAQRPKDDQPASS